MHILKVIPTYRITVVTENKGKEGRRKKETLQEFCSGIAAYLYKHIIYIYWYCNLNKQNIPIHLHFEVEK